MTDISLKIDSIADDLNKLANEMRLVLGYTKSLWGKHEDLGGHHFPYALYGFMITCHSTGFWDNPTRRNGWSSFYMGTWVTQRRPVKLLFNSFDII